MTRLQTLKEKLRATRVEENIRLRQANAAQRAYQRILKLRANLEGKILKCKS